MVAVHGSVATPVLQDSGRFTLPRGKGQGDWEETKSKLEAEKVETPEEKMNQAGDSSHDLGEEKIIMDNRVIALDFDDVCCQNVLAMCLEHNAVYGTDLTP
jgi:hypothetical protein